MVNMRIGQMSQWPPPLGSSFEPEAEAEAEAAATATVPVFVPPPLRLRVPLCWIPTSTRRVLMHLPYWTSPLVWMSAVRLDCPKLNWDSALGEQERW